MECLLVIVLIIIFIPFEINIDNGNKKTIITNKKIKKDKGEKNAVK